MLESSPHTHFLSSEDSTSRLNEMLDEAYKMRVKSIPDSISLAQEVLQIAVEIKNDDIVAKANNQLGLFYMIIGDYQHSREYSQKALEYFRLINDKKGKADAKFNIASTYYKTDDFHQGLKLLLKCFQLYNEIDDNANKAKVQKALGTIYDYLGDTGKAIESYEKCIESATIVNDLNMVSNAYNPLSSVYLKLGNFDLAMELAEKSITIKKSTNDERGLGFSIYGRGKVHLKLKNHSQALEDFYNSLEIHNKMGDMLGKGMVLNKLGTAFFQIEDYQKSIDNLQKALQIGERYNIRLIKYKAYYSLYQVYKTRGDFQLALEHLENYSSYKDAAVSSQTQNVIKSYESISKIEALEREAKAQRDYYDLIEQKNVELDSFFYRVSHDLKGPISSLMGLHSLLQYESFEDKAMQYFNMYNQQFTRIHMIVMDLINLTRMKHIEENNVLIDFKQIAIDCVDSYTYLENHKNIRFDYHIDENLNYKSQWVIVNTILQNLIENAIKYSKPNFKSAYVSIKILNDDNKIKISVVDNGNGISAEDQTKIFEMFYRANDQTEGTGLGLYILKRAVERLRGEVFIESDLGHGTTFEVTLPY